MRTAIEGLVREHATRRHERGQGIVEYGLILGGIAVVAVVTLVFFGDVVAHVLDLIGGAIDQATD